MYPAIKASALRVRWGLREVYKVTQWKDGCVYKTRSLGIISCTPEYADELRRKYAPDVQIGSISTRVMRIVG